jgi:hypothetical protein
MRRKLIWLMAPLMVVALPMYTAAVDTETEVEETIESDDGEIETEREVEVDRDDDEDTVARSRVESRKESFGPAGGVESEVHEETETTVDD